MGIEVVAATADAGGGGSIDHKSPELIQLGIMDENVKFANCVLHALHPPVPSTITSPVIVVISILRTLLYTLRNCR